MSAERYDDGKPDYGSILFYFPEAMLELVKARDYGIKKYTKRDASGEITQNGRDNFRGSIGKTGHKKFRDGCIKAALRHITKSESVGGCAVDEPQDGVRHLAFAALNLLIALEYDSNKGPQKSTRYDWEMAPDWAQYATIDREGFGSWRESLPSRVMGAWTSESQSKIMGNPSMLQKGEDWRYTLEERP